MEVGGAIVRACVGCTHYPLFCGKTMATPLPASKKEDCAVNSRALQKSFSDIVTAISISDPLKVGDALFTASLVPQETLAKLELPTNTDYMKSRILVMSVMDQVRKF